jgi:GTPase SAR1 family protein
VKRVLITGMSGTGKSSLLHELAARSYRSADTDYGDYFQAIDGERLWREDRISTLLSSAPDELPGVLFVQGTTRNQLLFYPASTTSCRSAHRPRSWQGGWPREPPTPTGNTRPSWQRRCSTSKRWNRCIPGQRAEPSMIG